MSGASRAGRGRTSVQHIEACFPIGQVNPLAQREANAKRPIYMLHF